jgi:O-antigen ligase
MWNRILVFCIVAGAPFTYAGTLSVGFPLKISELAVALYLVKWAISKTTITLRYTFPGRGPLQLGSLLLVFAAVISFFLAFAANSDGNLQQAAIATRFGVVVDAALKVIYLLMAVCLLWALSGDRSVTYPQLARYWVYGALLSAAYGLISSLAIKAGIVTLLLPGHEVLIYNSWGGLRQATFLEGNYAGCYFVISVFASMALWKYQYRSIALSGIMASLLGIGLTESTAAVISLFIGLFVFVGLLSIRRGHTLAAIFLVVLILPLLALFSRSSYYERVVIGKIGDNSGLASQSKQERLIFIEAGIEMWKISPLFGVGPSNYANIFPSVADTRGLGGSTDGDVGRLISNNVYIEVLSEFGALGFCGIMFLIFGLLWSLWKYSKFDFNIHIYVSSLIAVLVYWVAFPAVIMLFVWMYFAICLHSVRCPSSSLILNNQTIQFEKNKNKIREANFI